VLSTTTGSEGSERDDTSRDDVDGIEMVAVPELEESIDCTVETSLLEPGEIVYVIAVESVIACVLCAADGVSTDDEAVYELRLTLAKYDKSAIMAPSHFCWLAK